MTHFLEVSEPEKKSLNMSAFKRFGAFDERMKHSVYCWIKNMQRVLNMDNIPPEIIDICLLFYRPEEVFDIISENNHKIQL